MFKLLKKKFNKQSQTQGQAQVDQIHYDAFGNAVPNVALKRQTIRNVKSNALVTTTKQKSPSWLSWKHSSQDQQTDLVIVNNNAVALKSESKEQHLAKALSQQMHYALDKMNRQLNVREMYMEERFEQLSLERGTKPSALKTKKSRWLMLIGGMFAGVIMVYLLYIMQSMQTSMDSMSGDIGGMTNDITQMSVNTKNMSNNMESMNQGVSGMNQQMEGIATSIEPMGETAESVSPFAEMFNRLSPF